MKFSKQDLYRHRWLIIGLAVGVLLLLFGGVTTSKKDDDTLDVRVAAYTEALEKKAKNMISELDGVSDVHVMVMLEGSATQVYASSQSGGGTYVLMQNGNGQSPLLLREDLAQIRGISVVCKNGDVPRIKEKIIGLLSTGFGIPTNRVFVAGR